MKEKERENKSERKRKRKQKSKKKKEKTKVKEREEKKKKEDLGEHKTNFRKRFPLQTGTTREVLMPCCDAKTDDAIPPWFMLLFNSCEYALVTLKILVSSMVKWGVFICKSFSDLYVTLVKLKAIIVMSKTIST